MFPQTVTSIEECLPLGNQRSLMVCQGSLEFYGFLELAVPRRSSSRISSSRWSSCVVGGPSMFPFSWWEDLDVHSNDSGGKSSVWDDDRARNRFILPDATPALRGWMSVTEHLGGETGKLTKRLELLESKATKLADNDDEFRGDVERMYGRAYQPPC